MTQKTLIPAMTETETAVGRLSKQDVAAMRKADVASFHWTAKYSEYRWTGNGEMRLTKRLRNAGPLDEQERTHAVAVECELTDYSEDDGAKDWPRGVHCFDMLHTCSMTETWKTIAYLARPGDVLSFRWIKNNDNGNLRDTAAHVRLHRDEMQLILRRGDRKLTFDLCCGICPDNSARMIRRA